MTSTSAPRPLRLLGAPLSGPTLPEGLGTLRSGADGGDDPFLPAGLVRVEQAFALGSLARDGQAETIDLPAEQVVLLELEEGLTLITTAGALERRFTGPQAPTVADRGLAGELAGLVTGRLFRLDLGVDAILEEARERALDFARRRLGEVAGERLRRAAELGVSWWGTRALMAAIEQRLPVAPGLYRWSEGQPTDADRCDEGDPRLTAAAAQGPLLVLIHGVGSSSEGSFGDLRSADPALWRAVRTHYGDRIFAFEHRTFSEGPIENALALARVLPRGARVALLTHCRGGLVGDLLTLEDIDDGLIEGFRRLPTEIGAGESDDRERLAAELGEAHAEHREQLRNLRSLLRERALRIERYVRVAAPARGTRLASAHLDGFLSCLLSLIGMVPVLAGNPIYGAARRVVLEIVRHRTNPALVPGIEAMLPDAPMGRLLAEVRPRPALAMAVVAGDVEGDHLVRRLALLLSDAAFFQLHPNDLLVDTDAMLAGIAPAVGARLLLQRGPRVAHFRYGADPVVRRAVQDWLITPDPFQLSDFTPLAPPLAERTAAATVDEIPAPAVRGGTMAEAPVLVLVPEFLASHLRRTPGGERIWFDGQAVAREGLEPLRPMEAGVITAERPFALAYGDLCCHLGRSHRLAPFAYDWRQPLDELADLLAAHLSRLLEETADRRAPVRLLAHGMGGLVVRALAHRQPAVWEAVMAREGARLVMLGTPNQGTHLMTLTLLGKSEVIRGLGRVDRGHSLQQLVNDLARFPGALQLLPRPGFQEVEGAPPIDTADTTLWARLAAANQDRWFGDRIAPQLDPAVLARGRWLWDRDGARPALPEGHADRVIYVQGQAANTPCGVELRDGRLWLLGTPCGDGWVSWRSGWIPGIGATYRLPADHGGLPDTPAHFPALEDLLCDGATVRLEAVPPEAPETGETLRYDAGPVPWPSEEELTRSLVGGQPRARAVPPAAGPLQVSCVAMDLRHSDTPVMVGHYQQDAIAGAEALIDRELVHGELSLRQHLGLYAGPVGTATVVLPDRNEAGSGAYRGAVVIGLGTYGELGAAELTEAVRVGTLRFLLQVVDRDGEAAGNDPDLTLSTLLLGYNSTTNISIEDSVAALVRGVLAANAEFDAAMPRRTVRVARLRIVELYLDTAISAARALRRLAVQLRRDGDRPETRFEAAVELERGEGWCHRLDAGQLLDYWPRLVVRDGTVNADPSGGGIATTLNYSFLGQRARAETNVQQRQPGLVEALIRQAVMQPAYAPELSRTLFQLLVPHAFKELTRRMDRLVMVLDATTANLPWELLLADEKPLALSVAMVRQLVEPAYRPRVRQTLDRVAYVVGNPATDGFHRVFPGEAQAGPDALPPLPGAEQEATLVAETLRRGGYEVEEAIGPETALDVINRLYRRPYRIVHIAAHGVQDQLTLAGDRRSGVVLTGGMLLGAAEIEGMENVPDLVFLNCCHLGTIDSTPVAFHRLAASLGRKLIQIGVRGVVACGWAVNDAAAGVFARCFYEGILANRPFGEAVFEARRATWAQAPASSTWGAYQAYGDPGFVLDPRRDEAVLRSEEEWLPVTPDELIVRLRALRHRAEAEGAAAGPALMAEVERLTRLCPSGWPEQAGVQLARADLQAALGESGFAEARRLYLAALQAPRAAKAVPLQAVERLVALELEQGRRGADAALVEASLERLLALVDLAGGSNGPRAAQLAGGYELLARLRAAAGDDPRPELERAIRWYGRCDEPAQQRRSHQLEVVAHPARRAAPALLAELRAAATRARAEAREQEDPATALQLAEVLLTLGLVDRSLAAPGAVGEAAQAALRRAFVASAPSTERESGAGRLADLADLVEAVALHAGTRPAASARLAQRLRTLAEVVSELSPP